MSPAPPLDTALLDAAGLNLVAVFELDGLPDDVATLLAVACPSATSYRQLILIGHAGRALWEAVKAFGLASANPIDDFTVRAVEAWASRSLVGLRWERPFPGEAPLPLQRLGQLAGWHHPSPFMVGVNWAWGPWFAYRAVLLADSRFQPTPPVPGDSPCDACAERPCVLRCVGGALAQGAYDAERCGDYRAQPGSRCEATCLARLACPVGREHRYEERQLRHAYGASLKRAATKG